MQPPLDPVAPLKATANRWMPATLKAGTNVKMNSPVIVEQKVNALLNNLTIRSFDSISDQIIGWANRSEKERDGRTLIQVIRLVFERAKDEENLSEMYARLCRKITDQISMKVQDDDILDNEGKPFAGGQLFRKYLLNRCQEDFERGWAVKEAASAAAAAKATKDAAAKESAAKGGDVGGVESFSDEYHAVARAKRRGLGLIRFIGELFKLQMLTERIMHECIKKLLGNIENPEEEDIESLCTLLTTVGSVIDTPQARAHMDVYFSRMKGLAKSEKVNSRMAFMLQDVIELRSNGWKSRKGTARVSSNMPDML
ncbi:ARM repeat-containing protein [Peniophora sp. CONT]|nr:ARM repeat-containing protein [Peniophora sp. CONT]